MNGTYDYYTEELTRLAHAFNLNDIQATIIEKELRKRGVKVTRKSIRDVINDFGMNVRKSA